MKTFASDSTPTYPVGNDIPKLQPPEAGPTKSVVKSPSVKTFVFGKTVPYSLPSVCNLKFSIEYYVDIDGKVHTVVLA